MIKHCNGVLRLFNVKYNLDSTLNFIQEYLTNKIQKVHDNSNRMPQYNSFHRGKNYR